MVTQFYILLPIVPITRTLLNNYISVKNLNKTKELPKEIIDDHHHFVACQIEKIKWLINYGFDINIRNDLGETPLHKAVENNVPEVSPNYYWN